MFVSFALAAMSFPGTAMQASGWKVPPRAARKRNPVPAGEATIAKGKAIFLTQCTSCHGESGVGDGPAAKDLEKHPGDLTSKGVQEQSDGALFWKISTGRAPMTAFKDTLRAEERWQVVRYVRTLAAPSVETRIPDFRVPDAMREGSGSLFEAYDACRGALARGDDAAAGESVGGIRKALERLGKASLDGVPEAISSAWRATTASIGKAVLEVEGARDLASRRKAFGVLSKAAETFWERFGHAAKGPLHVFVSGDGGLWVQAGAKPESPYAAPASGNKLLRLLSARRPEEQERHLSGK